MKLAVRFAILSGLLFLSHAAGQPSKVTTPRPSDAKSQEQPTPAYLILLSSTVISAALTLSGVIYTQKVTVRQKQLDELSTRKHRLNNLRATRSVQLDQLIAMLEKELRRLDNSEEEFTWLPVQDCFEAYRENKDLTGLLTPAEVASLTEAMWTLEERLGYIVRRASKPDLMQSYSHPIGRNIEVFYGDSRDGIREDLSEIRDAARKAQQCLGEVPVTTSDAWSNLITTG